MIYFLFYVVFSCCMEFFNSIHFNINVINLIHYLITKKSCHWPLILRSTFEYKISLTCFYPSNCGWKVKWSWIWISLFCSHLSELNLDCVLECELELELDCPSLDLSLTPAQPGLLSKYLYLCYCLVTWVSVSNPKVLLLQYNSQRKTKNKRRTEKRDFLPWANMNLKINNCCSQEADVWRNREKHMFLRTFPLFQR